MNIPNYPNYKIYENGNIENIKSKKILNTQKDKYGYETTKLYCDGKSKRLKIHRLLGICYIDNSNNELFIDHINRDKSDNRIENLRWVNKSENNSNRSAYKNSKLKERYITIIESKGNTYYKITIRQQKFIKTYNINKYDLESVKKIRDSIINAESNRRMEKEQTFI